ncbi:MAG: fused FliR family export protein/FlhB family type III secretion system protein [Clostridium butyricum]|nr:fused FliR family export protein/FlhB family type III secretion system protein [Clostridium butyricum]
MIDTAYFLALFYISLRLSAYFLVVDIFFPTGTPKMLKGILSLLISLSVLGGVDYSGLNASVISNYQLALFGVNEVMTGIVFGVVTNMIFMAAKFAGAWMDFHVGFMMTSMIDPATETQSTLLGNLTYMIATLIFFIVDGHHLVINSLIKSFDILSIGSSIIFQDNIMQVIEIIIKCFALGTKMAIPLVLVILITDLCLALITRTVPTIPVMLFGLPIKFLLGIFTYVLLLPMIFKIMANAITNLPNIFESLISVFQILPMVFIFADDKDGKTEEATPKKLSDAKKKGQVARSKDVNVAITMVVCTFVVAAFSNILGRTLKEVTINFLSFEKFNSFNELMISNWMMTALINAGKIILIFAVPILIAGVVASILQTGFIFTKEPIKFSLGKLKPRNGFKQIFSKRSWLNLGKNIAVVIIVSYMAYDFIKDNYNDILAIYNLNFISIALEIKNLVVDIFKKICLVLIVIGATDFYFQKKLHKKEMRMTKQEVKDEYKNMEGDPKIKAKQKQKQREIGMQRMMQSVADATVVITNPTHLAIALKYEEGTSGAPIVVGKGADYIALKIKNIAKENDVPIIENKPLARLMYEKVEIDQEIPQDLYQGVAEILAVVMKLKK